jgi:hypothetical protein
MTRLLIPAERVSLDADDDGVPISFAWRGRKHTVVEVVERWRADAEWWRVRQWREHFTIATNTRLLLTIYRDLSRGEWYVQRIFD